MNLVRGIGDDVLVQPRFAMKLTQHRTGHARVFPFFIKLDVTKVDSGYWSMCSV